MGLLSYFQRQPPDAADAPPVEPDAVAAARARARRRLIGATVLLAVGVVGFPLLFETQPRPVAVNIPIEIPRKDGAPPLAPPGLSPALSAASAATVLPDAEVPAAAVARPDEVTERAADAGREVVAPATAARPPAPAPAAASRAPAVAVAPVKPAPTPVQVPAPAPAPAAATKATDSARAQALLNGQTTSADVGGRVVVQVGAYAEADKLKEARQRVEKLGFKTYTQVVEVGGAKRTRVRVGPFASKAEADKAAARIKASGLPAAVLTL